MQARKGSNFYFYVNRVDLKNEDQKKRGGGNGEPWFAFFHLFSLILKEGIYIVLRY